MMAHIHYQEMARRDDQYVAQGVILDHLDERAVGAAGQVVGGADQSGTR